MTAYEIPGQTIPLIAAADMSANRYKAVVINSDGKMALAGANAVITGILRLPGVAGEHLPVTINGVVMGILGGTVAKGDKVSVDANGKFVKATAEVVDGTGHVTTAGSVVVGICMFGGDADGIGSILIK
jgi:hypothetical protein